MDHGSPEISEILLARKVAKSQVEDWRSCFPTPLNPQRSETRTPASQKPAIKGLGQGIADQIRGREHSEAFSALSQANPGFSIHEV